MVARRDIINKKRNEGLSGVITNISQSTEKNAAVSRISQIPSYDSSMNMRKGE